LETEVSTRVKRECKPHRKGKDVVSNNVEKGTKMLTALKVDKMVSEKNENGRERKLKTLSAKDTTARSCKTVCNLK